MANAIGLNGLEAFEKQQRLSQIMASWITFTHRHEIGARIGTQTLILDGVIGNFAQHLLGHFG